MKGNEIFVGKKPLMSYVLAVVTQFSESNGEVIVKARGRSINLAVDIVQIVKNKFAKDAKITSVKLGTDEVERKEGGKMNISSIEIVLKK
ncbi:MAG: DNA-binding protein Alba [Candidatus Aenigmarchaeota archaeon]|nr:DNA-binding protein Alba [Candidatus Aenigmarchaeota archaeon]